MKEQENDVCPECGEEECEYFEKMKEEEDEDGTTKE